MKWEYLVLIEGDDPDSTSEALDRFGEEEWELVCVDRKWIYLKRPLKEEENG